MNVTEKFSYNISTAGERSSAVESSELTRTVSADSVRALLSEWREEYHLRHGSCTQLCLSAEQLLSEQFLHDREDAYFIFDEICDALRSYCPVICINLYARAGRIYFEFYSEEIASTEKKAHDGLDLYELVELCESRGCALAVEEDMTGSMHLAVSFDHIDIGTVGFKSTPRIVRGDR